MPPGGDFTFHGDADEPDVTISVRVEGDAFYLAEVRLVARDQQSQITDADLKIPARLTAEVWTQWIMANLPAYTVNPDGSLGDEVPRDGTTYEQLRRAVERGRRRAKHGEVARVYRDGGARGAQAVADHFGVALRTAQLWVRQARDEGELGESLRGRAGEQA